MNMTMNKILLISVILVMSALSSNAENEKTSFFAANWLDAVVSIEVQGPTGDQKSVGTGFLVLSPSSHILLVTAKHVVIDSDGKQRPNLGYRLNTTQDVSIVISDDHATSVSKSSWYLSDEADVACRFIVWDAERTVFKQLTQSLFLKKENLQPGAPLYILGFPMGLRSEQHAMPIVRRGIVARCDAKSILAEAFVFPGNSGGPVVYAPEFHVDQKTLKSPVLQGQWIVGLVSNNIFFVDQAVSIRTLRPRVTFEDNSGLVNVVPGDAILKLLNREDVKKQDATKF